MIETIILEEFHTAWLPCCISNNSLSVSLEVIQIEDIALV